MVTNLIGRHVVAAGWEEDDLDLHGTIAALVVLNTELCVIVLDPEGNLHNVPIDSVRVLNAIQTSSLSDGSGYSGR